MKARGPGLEKTGVAVNKPAEFTVDAKHAGKAPLRVQVQVGCLPMLGAGVIGPLSLGADQQAACFCVPYRTMRAARWRRQSRTMAMALIAALMCPESQ